MAVTPITFTRVTHNLQTMSLLNSLRENTLELFKQQNRLATGKRLNAPSDDPILAGQALNLSQILDRQDHVLQNIQYADDFLAATDNAMTEITELITEAKTIASDMVNSVAMPEERAAEAEIINSIIDQLIQAGNRTRNGVYLFAGKDTLEPPFARQYDGVVFTGDTQYVTTSVGDNIEAPVNLTGDRLYGMLTGKIVGYQNLEPVPELDTRLKDLKGATELGVRLGSIRIIEDGGTFDFTADLTGADTVGDVVDAINQAAADAGASVTASLVGNGLVLSTGGATSIEVQDIADGTTAADLGIRSTAAAPADLVGDNLHAKIVGTTRVSALDGGLGVALAGVIRITNGTLSKDVDLSAAQTVQEILNALNTADVGIHAQINDDANGFDVINLVSGSELRITEVAGGTTADNLGILSLHGGLSLSELNHGQGVTTDPNGTDFRVHARDGSTFDVNLTGATTVQDVIDAVNAAAAAAGVAFTASLNPDGPGLRFDDATGGAGVIRFERMNQSFAVDDLGLAQTSNPGDSFLISNDVAGRRPASVFSALLDLEAALRGDDTQGINAAAQELEQHLPALIKERGTVGARAKAMHERAVYTEDAVTATRALLSQVEDVDYTEAVTKFQQAQTALQANLMTGSRMLSLSLLDFLG
jgi:flagellar hook-associated protein 3